MTPAEEGNGGLRDLLEYLNRNRGFDFTGYKRASLERRIKKRMAEVGCDDYRDYLDVLEVNPGEFTALFDTILINVTGFFRDEPAWDYLAREVVPQIIEANPQGQPIRVWSAGCASGEEAYTIAMVLGEALGEDAFKERVKIYATDVDEDALRTARHALYPADALEDLPEGLAERYFEPNASGYAFRPDLRRQVIFGRNDLVKDAPISRIDLLVSRNTLMYFTAEAQANILAHFNFALKDTGFLFLGKSEMLLTHTELFVPHDLKRRVFTKVRRAGLRERLTFADEGEVVLPGPVDRELELRAAALEDASDAQLVVGRTGTVVAANRRVRELFDVKISDVGRPLQDLEVSFRPTDLRSAVNHAYASDERVRLPRVRWTVSGEERMFEIGVTPLHDPDGVPMGASIDFRDVTIFAELDAEHERSKRQLETAYNELQSTVEELETTNEELHSTNEELETTNEELQSTNEELETMNEELHSTNDELEAMNDEQAARTSELDRLNLFLEGILGSLGVGVVVVDRDKKVQVWNASSQDLWGLTDAEAFGQDLFSLDIGLPLHELGEAVDRALGGAGEAGVETVEAITRRGRAIECWVKVQPLTSPAGENFGAILLMADRDAAPLGHPG